MEAEVRAILDHTLAPPPALDEARFRRLQERAMAAVGGARAAAGEVQRFLAERRAAWGE